MSRYDVDCPICGKTNYSLDFEETDGWMECDRCMAAVRFQKNNNGKMIPVSKLRNEARTDQVA